MITDFPRPSGANIGGMYLFQFIESRYVPTILIPRQRVLALVPAITMGQTWKRGYNTILTLSWNEQAIDDPNRPKYKQELVGFCPEFNATLENLFYEMMYERFVLDCFDNQMKRIIAGSPQNGMRFEWKFTTHPEAKGRKGYAYRFFRDSDEPAIFVSSGAGILTDDDGGAGESG